MTANQDKPVRVLIVDDEEDDFILTSAQINDIPSWKFEMEWCSNYRKAVERIGKAEHDIYFIDYRLGAKTGLDLLQEPSLKLNEAPVILLTGQGNKEIDLQAMKLGAVDYLIKSELNPEKLERCIRYSLERASNLRLLRAGERKYRNIFEKTRDVIFLLDDKMEFKDINESASELFGIDRNELFGRGLYDFMADDGEKHLLAKMIEVKGQVDDFQIDLVTHHSQRKIVLISASRETDNQGVLYIQGILHDITLLKRTEEIKIQAEKLESKGRVIRTLAHEIRNPLNNINVSIHQLQSIVSQDDTELLNIVHRSVKRIDDLISELMDSSRYFKMAFLITPLQTVLDRAIEETRDRMVLKKIKLEVSYPSQAASALLDQEKIKIAFVNIILNAIEAMEENTGILKVGIRSSNDLHEVMIADNGCGMSEEVASRLFEPYFTAKPDGVGIGLSSAYGIIQSHKSTVTVDSKLNEGTVFTISFPSL